MNQTISDLQDDFTKISTLAQSGREKVLQHQNLLKEHSEWYLPEAHAHLIETANRLERDYRKLIESAEGGMKISDDTQEPEIKKLISRKGELNHVLRILQGELGALLAAGDWQSPTFDHTLTPLAGKQTGKIVGTINDYKRDFHFDSTEYEKAFCEEYVETGGHLSVGGCVTSSGMSAFATLVNHLQYILKIEGPIMVGRASYFQNQWILNHAFPDKIVLFDEFDNEAIIEKIKKIKPAAFFIDTICNEESIPVPDFAALLPLLAKNLPFNSVMVIDNTGMTTGFQPLLHLPRFLHPKLFVIESLMKYHQFGMDRVTGGIIWCSVLDRTALLTTRMNLGTILPDASTLALPAPSRNLLDKQLRRFDRNALMLARALDEKLKENSHLMISHIVYPGLESYRGYSWTKDHFFHGSYFVIAFRPIFRNALMFDRVIDSILNQAKKAGVNLVAGSSFGMDVTRLYVTAKHANKPVKPFLRVSVGTETEMEMKKLIEVFIKALW